MNGYRNILLGVALGWTSILFRGVVILVLVASFYRDRVNLRPYEPLRLELRWLYLLFKVMLCFVSGHL